MPKTNMHPAPSSGVTPTSPTAAAVPPAVNVVLSLLDGAGPATAADLAARAGLGRSTVTKALAALEKAGLAVRQPGGHDGGRRIADLWLGAAPVLPVDRANASEDAAVSDSGRNRITDGSDGAAASDRFGAEVSEVDTTPDTASSEAEATTTVDADQRDMQRVASDAGSVGDGHRQADKVEDGPAAARLDEGGRPASTPAGDGGSLPAAGSNVACESTKAGGNPPADCARLGKGELREQVLQHLKAFPDREWTPSAIARELGRSAGAITNACDKLVALGAATTFEDKPRRFQLSDEG